MRFLRLYFTFVAFGACIVANAQNLRNSLLQYQMNALALNPAYSAYEPASGFEASYLGNFISEGNVSRSVLVNMQGATAGGGLGLTFQFYKNGNLGEVNLRPAWSRRYSLPNGNFLSFGAVVGLNYFDATNAFFSSVTSDFVSIDGGFGVYYQADRFFAGASVLNIFEKTAGLDANQQNGSPFRENPFSFHIGGVFPFVEDLVLKPVALFRYINVYQLPDQSFQQFSTDYALDLQANVFIENTYIVGLLYGFTNSGYRSNSARFGVSATYVIGNFRLTYAIQQNTQKENSVSLPVTHLITAGYDLGYDPDDPKFRFF